MLDNMNHSPTIKVGQIWERKKERFSRHMPGGGSYRYSLFAEQTMKVVVGKIKVEPGVPKGMIVIFYGMDGNEEILLESVFRHFYDLMSSSAND